MGPRGPTRPHHRLIVVKEGASRCSRYVVKRLLSGFLVVTLVSMMVFALFWYGPEEPGQADLRRGPATARVHRRGPRASYEERLGYNNPITEEYGKWVKGLFVGREIQFGTATYRLPGPVPRPLLSSPGSPVCDELKERLPATLCLAVGAPPSTSLVGVTHRRRRRAKTRHRRRQGAGRRHALHELGPLLPVRPARMLYLVHPLRHLRTRVRLRSPTAARRAGSADLLLAVARPRHLRLAPSTRGTRAARWSSRSSEDYIRTATAKGLPQRTVVYKHALRSALVPVVTIFGIDFAFLLAGTIFTEQIFDIQGIGYWGLQATSTKDLPSSRPRCSSASIIIVLANIIVDILYSVLDPRVRLT